MTLEARLVDITTLAVDAIVNAANTSLAPGGGVCGAIHRAAGPELAIACGRFGGCPTGQARITPGFRLPGRYVIHAVGPIWEGGQHGEPALLALAYNASIDLASEWRLRRLAFPAISTGIFGYPLAAATKIAVTTVRTAIAPPRAIEQIIFACFSREALDAYVAEGVSAG